MNFIFLMDPLELVFMEKDTSFIFMWGARQRGHKVFFLADGGITRKGSRFLFHVNEVIPQKVKAKPFLIKKPSTLTDAHVDAVFIRTDPPFDSQYLVNTWLLDLLPKHIAVINNPNGIRTVNEKIWATQFTAITPPTLVGRNRAELLKFLHEQKEIIVKPTDGHGGKSIFRLRKGDTNTNVIFETVTEGYTKDVLLQRYVPAAAHGDKRILLLNGEPLGAVLRVHANGEHRNNIFAGGHVKKTTITTRDLEIIKVLKLHLRALGLYFVGIDLIGQYLIEVNVTSPTCLQEMNRIYNLKLEQQVMAFVENLVDQLKAKHKIITA